MTNEDLTARFEVRCSPTQLVQFKALAKLVFGKTLSSYVREHLEKQCETNQIEKPRPAAEIGAELMPGIKEKVAVEFKWMKHREAWYKHMGVGSDNPGGQFVAKMKYMNQKAWEWFEG